jgi:predicted porin
MSINMNWIGSAAMAAAFASNPAQAQSGVSISGVVDLGVQRVKASGSGSSWQLGNSGLTTSRLIFRGTEALGDGLSAGFWLESGLNPDTGTGRATNTNNQPSGAVPAGGLAFDRRAYVMLAGKWGELRLGRDFVPTQYTNIEHDAFSTNGIGRIGNLTYSAVGAGPLPPTIAASNTVNYWTPSSLGGFYGMAMVAFGENSSSAPNKNDGRLYSVRAGYANGPLNVSAAHSRTSYVSTATIGNYRHSNVGARWDAGFAKIFALHSRATVALGAGDVRKDVWSVGVQVPVGGTGVVRLSYAELNDKSDGALRNANATLRLHNDARQMAVGYVYHLSKRTATYATYSQIDNRGQGVYVISGGTAPSPGGRSSGVEAGLRHSF